MQESNRTHFHRNSAVEHGSFEKEAIGLAGNVTCGMLYQFLARMQTPGTCYQAPVMIVDTEGVCGVTLAYRLVVPFCTSTKVGVPVC